MVALVAASLVACGDDGSASDGFSASASGSSGTIGDSTSSGGSTSGGSTSGGSTSDGSASGSTSGGSTGSGGSTSAGETSGTTAVATTTGDPTTTGGDEVCAAPGELVVCDLGLDGSKSDHAFAALGVGCKGAIDNTIPISNARFKKFSQWNNPESWRVAASFGEAEDPNMPGMPLFRPREGERFLIISTGRLGVPDGDGALIEPPGSQYDNNNNANDDGDALMAPLEPAMGSNGGAGGTPFMGCDGVGDCSDSIWPNWVLGNQDPNDQLALAFDVTAPEGVHGFLFDFVFFSSEYPAFVDKEFNDMLIAWSTSEAYTGNITFFEGEPLTVTSLATAMESAGYVLDDPELAGTGFEGHGSTGWASVEAPVNPLESFTFAVAIMDMGDSNKASAAILDNWRWDCAGCVSKEVDPACGGDGHPPCCGVCVEPEDDPDCGSPGHPSCCPDPK
ncbi:MAG: choice-of-anchor L domain-containing protein [Myxococcales bacterium]|nr:choice-of-anchor L domain-containing protein [Myxococcales bacterium]